METNTLWQDQHTYFYTYGCLLMMWFNHLLLCRPNRTQFLLVFLQCLRWFIFICLTSGRYLTTMVKTEETARCYIGIELGLKPNPFLLTWLMAFPFDRELFIALQQPIWQYNIFYMSSTNEILLMESLLWQASLVLTNKCSWLWFLSNPAHGPTVQNTSLL